MDHFNQLHISSKKSKELVDTYSFYGGVYWKPLGPIKTRQVCRMILLYEHHTATKTDTIFFVFEVKFH